MKHPTMLVMIALAALVLSVSAGFAQVASKLNVYGGMHETLAKGDHQARVNIVDLLAQENFYAVGAVAGLHGEITVLDSAAFVTGVAPGSGLKPLDSTDTAATLLVGQTVPCWSRDVIGDDVPPDRFDGMILTAAAGRGVDASTPFMFIVEGELTDVRIHVINGACPVHARMQKIELTDDRLPFEYEAERIQGTVVGVYASDAVGKLTHPATSVHAHLIYIDESTGEKVTGHIERVGVAAGATVKVPAAAASGEAGGDR